eukprot:5271537-Pyramimonas_sp.AAC.1
MHDVRDVIRSFPWRTRVGPVGHSAEGAGGSLRRGLARHCCGVPQMRGSPRVAEWPPHQYHGEAAQA